MNRIVFVLLLCNILLTFNQLVYAEDYSECKVRCNQEFAACMNNTDATSPQQPAAKNAACEEKLQACYAVCKDLRQKEENTGKNIIKVNPPQ